MDLTMTKQFDTADATRKWNSGYPGSIGFIGLGNMGIPMVLRLLQHGHSVNVWSRTPERSASVVAAGATLVSSPQALAERSEIVGLCLSDGNAVEEVAFGSEGLFLRDALATRRC
ncbi:NAD(P)-binding domain-containing protein [Undibacterium arcticum]